MLLYVIFSLLSRVVIAKIILSLPIVYLPRSPSKADRKSDSQLLNLETSLLGRSVVISEGSILTPLRPAIGLGQSESGSLSSSYESELGIVVAGVREFSQVFPSHPRASILALRAANLPGR